MVGLDYNNLKYTSVIASLLWVLIFCWTIIKFVAVKTLEQMLICCLVIVALIIMLGYLILWWNNRPD